MACRFSWDEAKYPTMTPLREIVDTIQESVSKLEDDLKVFCFFSVIVCFFKEKSWPFVNLYRRELRVILWRRLDFFCNKGRNSIPHRCGVCAGKGFGIQ